MIRSSLLRMMLGRPRPIRQMLSHPVSSARGVSLPPCPFCLGANRRDGPAEAKTNSGSEDTNVVVECFPTLQAVFLLCVSVFYKSTMGNLGANGTREKTEAGEGVIIRTV